MKVTFAAPSSRDDDNRFASSARLINFFREPVGQRVVLRSHLGTEAFTGPFGSSGGVTPAVDADVDTRPPAALHTGPRGDERHYALLSNGLLEINSDTGAAEYISNIGAGTSGPYSVGPGTLGYNSGYIFGTASGQYFVTSSTGEAPTAAVTTGAVTNPQSAFFYNNLTVVCGGRRVAWSDPDDPTTFDGLSFATKEAKEDQILRGTVINDTIVIFGDASTEYWTQTTAGDLQIRPGAVDEVGLKSFDAMATGRDTLFFIGTNNTPYITQGQGKQPIYNAAVVSSIQNESALRCFYYEDRGHQFFVISFPGRASWVYDLGTQEWSERAYGNELGAFPGVCSTWDAEKFLVGVPGHLYKLTRNSVDVGGALIRRAVSETIDNQGELFIVRKFTLVGEFGWADGDPQVVLRTSNDYGQSWRLSKQRSLGANGEFEQRPTFRALGQYRRFTAEVTISDPYDVSLDSEALL